MLILCLTHAKMIAKTKKKNHRNKRETNGFAMRFRLCTMQHAKCLLSMFALLFIIRSNGTWTKSFAKYATIKMQCTIGLHAYVCSNLIQMWYLNAVLFFLTPIPSRNCSFNVCIQSMHINKNPLAKASDSVEHLSMRKCKSTNISWYFDKIIGMAFISEFEGDLRESIEKSVQQFEWLLNGPIMGSQ